MPGFGSLAPEMAYDPATGMPYPTTPVDPAMARVAANVGGAIFGGLKSFVETPGRAMQDGITTDQAVNWAAPTAMGMIGMGPIAAERGAVGAAGGKLGQPEGIRAYHGSTTIDGPFSPYGKELGPHFGTLSQATDRVIATAPPWEKPTFKEDARIAPVDLNFKNPVEIKDVTYWDPASVLNQMGKITTEAGERIFPPSELSSAWSNYRKWKKSAFLTDERSPAIRNTMLDQIRDLFTGKGYDAIKYNNLWEGQTSKKSNVAYIPLERGTVRSPLSGATLYGAAGAMGVAASPEFGFGSLIPSGN